MCDEPQLKESKTSLIFAFVAVAAMAAIYTAFHYHTHNHDELRRATEHLLQGKTHWVTFQNRILAPWLIQIMRDLTGWSWLRVFYFLVFGCMASGGSILVWRAWRRYRNPAYGLAQVTAWFLLGFVFNDPWSYPWDFIGALLNLFLLLWALDDFLEPSQLWSWKPCVLVAALILNRESSLIALCALLAATVGSSIVAQRYVAVWRPCAVIVAVGAANVAMVIFLRRTLFVQSTRPDAAALANELSTGNFMQLRDNWYLLATNSHPFLIRTVVLAISAILSALCGVILFRLWRARRKDHALSPGCVFAYGYFGLACGAVVLFAAMQELRVYFELIPFLVILGGEDFVSPAKAAQSA
jgi:hypothetical protein